MSLTIGYWNCASGLVRKASFIINAVKTKNLDALFIAEAEVCDNVNLSFIIPDGCELFCAPTLTSRKKCRLICVAKRGMFRNVLNVNALNDIIFLEHKKSLIVGGYRGFKCFESESERSNFIRIINDLDKIDFSREVIIVGDFNIDMDLASINENNNQFLTTQVKNKM